MSNPIQVGPDRHGLSIRAHGGAITAIDEGGAPKPGAIEPGRINAHTHIYSGLAPLGMPPPEPPPNDFVEILERVWWRLDRALDERSLRAAARYYVAESLLAGATTLIDHHESPNFISGSLDVLADACQELGMRAVVGFGATERNFGRDEARRGLAECRRFIESNERELIRGAVALHASFTVSDETISEAGDLCRELDTVMHVHVAEDGADVADAKQRGYDGPLERLLQLGALPPGSILAHGVHCSPEQVRLAADHGLWFVHNPRSNRGNGVGYSSGLIASAKVALGTDGYPSNLGDEAGVLASEAARHGQSAGEVAYRLDAGYELVEELFGQTFKPLVTGGAADLVVTEEGRVRDVVVGGRRVVRDGRLTSADLEEIRATAAEEAERLWARLPASER